MSEKDITKTIFDDQYIKFLNDKQIYIPYQVQLDTSLGSD